MALDYLGDDAITVGTFDFPESELLGELYGQVLEAPASSSTGASVSVPAIRFPPCPRADRARPRLPGTALRIVSAGAVAPRATPRTHQLTSSGPSMPTTITAPDAAPAQNVDTSSSAR